MVGRTSTKFMSLKVALDTICFHTVSLNDRRPSSSNTSSVVSTATTYGADVGATVGEPVGNRVGDAVGLEVGDAVGLLLGESVGFLVGVAATGIKDGPALGAPKGESQDRQLPPQSTSVSSPL